LSIEIELSDEGRAARSETQQVWFGQHPGVLQTAYFAGHEMRASQSSEDPDIYELYYLGLVAHGFPGIAEAMASGPAFAKEVFKYLDMMIDEEH
jgi:hypothetical protein